MQYGEYTNTECREVNYKKWTFARADRSIGVSRIDSTSNAAVEMIKILLIQLFAYHQFV